MSVYIPGMEMPKACVYRENGHLTTCPLYDIDGYCGALQTEAKHKEDEIHSDCPLVPVPEHGKWIPVTEQLPGREWVLCKCRAKIHEVLSLRDGYWYHDPQHKYMSGFVTHWMPLPEKPKERTISHRWHGCDPDLQYEDYVK